MLTNVRHNSRGHNTDFSACVKGKAIAQSASVDPPLTVNGPQKYYRSM